METIKARCLIQFKPGYELATQGCFPTNARARTVLVRLLFAFLTGTLTGQQVVGKQKVIGRPKDDRYNHFNTKQQTSEKQSTPISVIHTVAADEQFSLSKPEDKKKQPGGILSWYTMNTLAFETNLRVWLYYLQASRMDI